MDTPSVLVLVKDADQRQRIMRRLIELEVVPVVVQSDAALAAIERYHPIAAVLDEPHAAMAPEDFLTSSWQCGMHLVTIADSPVNPEADDRILRHAIGRDQPNA